MTAPVPTVGGASVASRIASIRQRFEPVRTTGSTPQASTTSTTTAPDAFAQVMALLEGGASALNAPGTTYLTGGLAGSAGLGGLLGLNGAAGGPSFGSDVVDAAATYQGVPYLWGGTDPSVGLDCSGFVQRVFRDLGVDLPRVSRDQARQGSAVPSIAEARPGDLIAFGEPVDHIAIYVGDGKIIHAPRTGDVVRITDIHRTPTAIRRIETPTTGAPVGSWTAVAGGSAILSDPAVARYAHLFTAAGRRHGIDPSILAAVAKVESGGNASAVSSAGARGLMQFMPATARGYGIDPLDPAQAIDGAARMLTEQRRAFGSLELALAAYNAGPGAVRRHGGIPPFTETQNYVRKVMSHLVSTS